MTTRVTTATGNGTDGDPGGGAPTGTGTGRGEAWRLLMGHLRPFRWTMVAGGLLGFLGGLAGLAEPLAARAVVEALGDDQPVRGAVLTLTALVLVGAGMVSVGMYVLARTGENVVFSVRRRLIGRVLRLPVTEVERIRPGDLIARLTSDTTLLSAFTGNGLVDVVNGLLVIVGSVVLMALLDPVLLGVALGVVALIGTVVMVLMPRIGRATEAAQAAVGEMGATAERALGAVRTVKASGAEAREAAVIDRAARVAWRRGTEAAGWSTVVMVASSLAVQVSFLAVLGVGGARVADGAVSVATLIAFLLYLFYLVGPIAQVVGGLTQLQSALAAAHRIHEVERLPEEPLGSPVTVISTPGTTTGGTGPAAVEVDRLSFRYDPGKAWVHRDVSFTVPAGSVTALVGPSGVGKSTLFALLERFHEPDAGRILLDGRELSEWSLPELRAAIGYVEQEAPVLAGTLRDNLRYASPEATDAEVAEVLRLARLDELVGALPDGLDTAVGHRGATLSGGERQRIAIARALLRRPRLLLLDEATSQLDAVNELALREVIGAVAETSTVLVIAHRLSTVTAADQIVVLDAGRVRATGTHAELLDGDELYRTLAVTQGIGV